MDCTSCNRRQWYLRGGACAGDVTWGALGTCMRELGSAQTELEGPICISLDASAERQCVRMAMCLDGVGGAGP